MFTFVFLMSLAAAGSVAAVDTEQCICNPSINIHQQGCPPEAGGRSGVVTVTSEMRDDEVKRIFENVTSALLGDYNNLVASVLRLVGNGMGPKPQDCTDLRLIGKEESGVYTIFPKGTAGFQVYCDMDMAGGDWTVIQRRVNGSVDFFLPWRDYMVGFGDVKHEFWLGNQQIHAMVSQGWYELRIDMVGPEDEIRYAGYDVFSISDVNTQYTLNVDGYHGDAGDMLSGQSGMKFSTKDRDNDIWENECAASFTGAWWYSNCHSSNLNGKYGSTSYATGITWRNLTTYYKSLKQVEMKVRKCRKT